MNCPSRNDDIESKHPTWNQNPPVLAGDLTTCEDLNGIANSREHKEDSVVMECLPSGLNKEVHETQPPGDARTTCHPWARHSTGVYLPVKTAAVREGCIRLQSPQVTTPSRAASIRSWVTWGLSVAISSFVLSNLSGRRNGNLQSSAVKESNMHGTIRLRKRATCPVSSETDQDLYNTPLHVGALFIILFVSTVTCSFPMLAARFSGIRLPGRFFFIVRHFGTGVLIATAFVHLLPTAFIMLGDPCLSGFWTADYPAMPGAIALAGIFLVAVVEMVFHPSRRLGPATTDGDEDAANQTRAEPLTTEDETGDSVPRPQQEEAMAPVRNMGPLRGRNTSIGRSLSRISADSGLHSENPISKDQSECDAEAGSTQFSLVEQNQEQKLRKAILQCVLLEVGILFHSLFIGMALSVSFGSEFVILLVAIAFHQTFEGLALGSRIASIKWPAKTLQPWFMALAYGCTTPIGQAIGLATHSLYSPNSEVGLLLVGIMNAISAGLLVFASLVELLSEDFLSDDSWKVLRGANRVFACLLVFFGAFSMSLVGAWA